MPLTRRRFFAFASLLGMPLSALAAPPTAKCGSGRREVANWLVVWDAKRVSVQCRESLQKVQANEAAKWTFSYPPGQVSLESALRSVLTISLRSKDAFASDRWWSVSLPAVLKQVELGGFTYLYQAVEDAHRVAGFWRFPKGGDPRKAEAVRARIRVRKGKTSRALTVDRIQRHEAVLTDAELDAFFGSDTSPLVVELELDGKPLLTSTGPSHGVAGALAEARSAHQDAAGQLKAGACAASDDGCFLTTATCGWLGLPDDCWELETLRGFRDTWMQQTPELVAAYYATAPAVVDRIASSPDAAALHRAVYVRYVLPSALLVKLGRPAAAQRRYTQLMAYASTIA